MIANTAKILRYCRSQPFSKCASQTFDNTLYLDSCVDMNIYYHLFRSRFTSGQQESPRSSDLRTSAQRDRQPKDANSALSWTWAPQVLKPLRDRNVMLRCCFTAQLCACIGVNLLQYRQSHGGPNDVSDNEILFQTPLPDLLSLLLQ